MSPEDVGTQFPAHPDKTRLHLFDDAEGVGYRVASPSIARRFVQASGALVSIGLIGLAVWWGYKQTMRDLHGVPVVQALDGPVRVAPTDPGGMVASHSGLAVNEVKAGGIASAPSAEVALAPAPVGLTEEDLSRPIAANQPMQSPESEAADMDLIAPTPGAPITASLSPDDPIARAVAEAVGVSLQDAVEGVVDAAPVRIASLPAWPAAARSPRPHERPDPSTATDASPAKVAAPRPPIDPAAIPAGTRLVQLGAFESPQDAEAAWSGVAGKFPGLMSDKDQVILEASAGGRSIWRLRAAGFEDLSDARRFCAALVAERTDCIPVVAR
jgi:hypothetical protein